MPGIDNNLADFLSRLQHSSPASIATLTLHAQELLAAALTPAYRRSWSTFSNFTTRYGLTDGAPVEVGVLSLFIAHLHREGFKPSTISGHISAIAYLHKLNQWPDPSSSFVIQKMLLSCHKQGGGYDHRLPTVKAILSRLLQALEDISVGPQDVLLFQTMFCLAFHAFLRIGETTVAAAHVVEHANLIMVNQVQLTGQYLLITLQTYKHSKGQPSFYANRQGKSKF